MYHIFFIHSSVEGHIGCFQVLAIKNNAAMNIIEQMPLWYKWASFGYMPKSSIAWSWGRLIPNFLRNCHIDFQSGCTSLYSHQHMDQWNWIKDPDINPHTNEHQIFDTPLLWIYFLNWGPLLSDNYRLCHVKVISTEACGSQTEFLNYRILLRTFQRFFKWRFSQEFEQPPYFIEKILIWLVST